MIIKGFSKKLYLVILGLTIALLSLEVIFRLVPYLKQNYAFERFIIQAPMLYWGAAEYRPSRLLGYEGIPNSSGLNSFGLVGDDFKIEKDDDACRILVLGDSIVAQNYFIVYIRDKLNKLSPDIKFELINGGVPGYEIWQNANFLKYKGLKFRPDIVLLSLCIGAFAPERMVYFKSADGIIEAVTVSQGRFQDIPFFSLTLFRYSYLYRMLLAGAIKILDRNATHNRKEEGIEKVGEIQRLCQQARIPILGFIWPYLLPRDKYDELMESSYVSMVEVLDYLGFDYIDLHNFFPQDEKIIDLRIGPDDWIHPSREGHRIAAEAIFEHPIYNYDSCFKRD